MFYLRERIQPVARSLKQVLLTVLWEGLDQSGVLLTWAQASTVKSIAESQCCDSSSMRRPSDTAFLKVTRCTLTLL